MNDADRTNELNIDIHADDYALCMNASRTILQAVKEGTLSSISILPNMHCYEDALKLWRDTYSYGGSLASELTDAETKNQSAAFPLCSVHLNFMEGYCVADKEKMSLFVDEKGYFIISWGTLVKYNYIPTLRKKAKEQLKLEIKAQTEKLIRDYGLTFGGRKLRFDSHQHSHMIPVVMESLLEVIDENGWEVEYIRDSREVWKPYLSMRSLYKTYRPINLVKVMVLNHFSRIDRKSLRLHAISPMILSGVFLSGRMDKDRVSVLLPALKECTKKRLRKETKAPTLELLFHPGRTLPEELEEDFNHPDANVFYLSENRDIELDGARYIRSSI